MTGELIVTCVCGYEVRGTADQLIPQVRQHGRDLHNMDVTDEQVLAMSRQADAPAAPGQ